MTIDERIVYYTKKADELLHLGDNTPGGEGRRLLRECRRYRLKVIELRKQNP